MTIIIERKAFDVTVPAHSINTFLLNDDTFEYHELSDEYPDQTEEIRDEDSTDVKFENAANQCLLSSKGYYEGTDITTTSNRGESY